MTEQIPTEGRIVHVRADGVGHCQPAIVVRHWGNLEPGACNLVVFRDGSNDREPGSEADPLATTRWATSVGYRDAEDPNRAGQTWHWPERVG